MSFKTPYSNMHELNLDWIMKAIKNLFGGTGGQYLRKKSNTQFDYEWHTITPSDIGAMPADATLSSQNVSFDRSENYTEPSIGAELKDIEDVVQIPTNLDGSVITFNTTEELPFLKCMVDMEPVQDLNGYDHPWPPGGNINKLPNNAVDGTQTINDVTITVQNGVYSLSGTATSNAIFSIPLSTSVDLSPSTNKIAFLNNKDNNGVAVGFARTGFGQIHYWVISPLNRVASGWTDTGNEVIDQIQIRVSAGVDASGVVFSPMLMLLTESNPTTFTPYSNVCPILGWTEENVWIKSNYDPASTPTKTIDFGGTCYGGSLDVIHGALKITYDNIASYAGETLTTEWISSMDVYSPGGTPTTGAQVVYKVDPPFIVPVQPTDALITIQGVNNVWCDTGNSEITIFKSLKEILNSL